VFNKILLSEMEENDGWEPFLFEHHFEFVYDNRVIIQGFIDRVDKKGEDYRTVDYKTSKKVYDKSKLTTSLQFGIYALAILLEFGRTPVESMYRFILIDDKQYALTKGWEKRLIKALDGIFDKIDADKASGVWVPKSSPLCFWCNFCRTNPSAHELKNECEYYSLWEPNNKTFSVNRQFNADDLKNNVNSTKLNTDSNKERKLVF
jgi:RecB family exonuclease